MRLTNRDLVQSLEAIHALRAMKLPVKTAHTIGLAFHKLEPYYNAYNESVKALRDAIPALDNPLDAAATPEQIAARKAAEKILTADVEDLLKVEVEIEQKALPLTLLVDRDGKELDVEVGHLQSLWWLFE